MKVAVASGKRKMAIARASVTEGKGRIKINSKPIEFHEPALAKAKMMEPLIIAGDAAQKMDIEVNVSGGGVMGQADASRTAIAKAIVNFTGDEDLKKKYIAYDRSLLVSDPRRKLPKKPLGRGARKKRQKSYR
ncbi:MAG: 30S ribosomal protein S9 [Thermoplasmata archaeon]|nr:30S ribosomal protein S9 [Thermoplasmata archaeon]